MQKGMIFTQVKVLEDPKSKQIEDKILKLVHLNRNFLIYGETGVGKDFWVNYLSRVGNFTSNLVNLNCGDVPENLLESEWFGFKKGAFSGALTDYEGKWTKAENGILFLNQIDLLSLNLQAKLLRIIERKKYYPIGSNQETRINCRFIFSAEADIEEKVNQGKFRQDLFYRISSYSIFIPPLRDRKSDIIPLIKYFAQRSNLRMTMSKEGQKDLLDYHWPGNIREIENFINNISIRKNSIDDSDVSVVLNNSQKFFDTFKNKEMSMEIFERQYIRYLMTKYKNKALVARILKISRKSIYNKLKQNEKG